MLALSRHLAMVEGGSALGEIEIWEAYPRAAAVALADPRGPFFAWDSIGSAKVQSADLRVLAAKMLAD